MGSHATATVGPSFLAAIAAAGFLHCAEQSPVASSQFRTFDRVHPYSASGARWTRKSRHDLWTGKKRSTTAADCYLCAQRAMVGAALAALPRIVTEIDGVALAHSRTYRNILSAVGVLCADRMRLFTKRFNFNGCFQQGCRRISRGSLQDRHIRT